MRQPEYFVVFVANLRFRVVVPAKACIVIDGTGQDRTLIPTKSLGVHVTITHATCAVRKVWSAQRT